MTAAIKPAVGAERNSLASRAALASVGLAVLLLVAKGWGAFETNSTAMLGSLADTALDFVASLATLAGVRIAAQPADREHRFGHGKAEALAALGQVALIGVSAVWIAWRGADRLINGGSTTQMELGIGVSLFAIAATLLLLWYQRRVIARTGSVAIRTDNVHYQSDLLLNLAVIAALLLDQWLRIRGADAVFGIAIAAWLLWGGLRASSQAVNQLMDREWPEEERARFLAAAAEYPELAGLHDLRTRTSGTHQFAQFHVWVPADWTVREAHDRMDKVEEDLQRRFPGTEILIHLDPEGHTDRETMLSSDLTERAT
ncbi:cation diffusion facilitator family transporter [Sphingomonas sp.]|uniref:cation diffusion facilitator family transporter n=1 Tax=Sphingomonas sp. TaxID=28214 RepID=UPI001804D1D3|nr:cation diffusion facilitator family transporter [Sphingomonas sp.]MBA3511759.1 cation diffusion facilitator family transporter [Sphingomonas sp.]